MVAIHGASWWEKLWVIEAPNRHIDPSRLLVALPTQHGPACATEPTNDAWRRSVLYWLPVGELELFGRNEKPCDRLCSGRTPAIGTVTNENLVGTTGAPVANGAASAASNELALFHDEAFTGGFDEVDSPRVLARVKLTAAVTRVIPGA